MCTSGCWVFHFTEPMKALLEIGSATQDSLLPKLSDADISDQVIILLGGVGDERAVEPIIDTMKRVATERPSDRREQTLTAGNLALTNITVADVIWHHGGGMYFEKCSDVPASCWAEWWRQNRAIFRVKDIKQSRRYTNYPNYGIYRGLP
jgi:hypothetical protein